MAEDDQKDPRDIVCSFCGKRAINMGGVISSQTESGNICNECLNSSQKSNGNG